MQYVASDGIPRGLGLLPTPADTIARLHGTGKLMFSHEHDDLKVAVPESEWVESDCSHFFKHRKDQKSTSMCVGASGAHAKIGTYAKQGFDIDLSPASIYAPICGGSDNGANLGDCYEALLKYGALPSGYAGIGDFDWKAAYRLKFWTSPQSDAGQEAAKHLLLEGVLCSSLDQFLSGLQTGQWCGQFGLGVGRNFTPDTNGWLPRCDGTRINHALAATGGMAKHPKTGKWGIQGLNSWGDWGPLNGIFFCEAEGWLDRPGQELWLERASLLPG